ncbi:wlac protein [Nitritalea halalkaliphila LW7]|uniref:Wlac protein n=1 Tax=Nitritalea halalkaliphila LW7 TaxID=1189621 RepID=I5BTG1_9BACT|nr:glycosyltransferase [Nitritalea halalkaliphila]EIM72863.1 wlac protein [Nitritalea halalkaliphila LW7]
MNKLTICIVVPSLKMGGMERVAATLVNELVIKDNVEVHLIILSRIPKQFDLHEKVILHEPSYSTSKLNFFNASLKTINYLRYKFKVIKPCSILSFGDRYNSIVILSSLFLNINVFVSNRQNPHVSNGLLVDLLNKLLYSYSKGIVAQTKYAMSVFANKYSVNNISVIPNPIKQIETLNKIRDFTVLNVGRFDNDKNQFDLINFFDAVDNPFWNLLFIGEGPKISITESYLNRAKLKDRIKIIGFTKEIEKYYLNSSIFAFTSISEGFPNALAEAMAAGCACIAYDCVAGPSDIIDDGVNGFLIPVGDEKQYIRKLKLLMEDEALRIRFSKAAQEKMKQFEASVIVERFYEFITSGIENHHYH